MDNTAPDFDQTKLLPPFCEIDNVTAEPRRFQDLSDLMTLYPDQFDVIGNLEGDYHIVTDPNVPLVQHPIRKTPIEYQEKTKKELDKMEAQGIITPVSEPTEWVNSTTYPMKPNGDLQICLDPKDLDRAILREHYKPPTLEEITHKLCGAKVFSKVDAFKEFFVYKLDKASSLKTTFKTTPRRG